MRGLAGKGDHSEGGKGKTQNETREKKTNTKNIIIKIKNKNKSKETQGHRMRCGRKRVSHVWSNSSLLEIGPSSAAEERVRVVSKHGCYMLS